MIGSFNLLGAGLALAAVQGAYDGPPPRRSYRPRPRDEGPITEAERNRRLNKAAAKSRKNAKRKAASKARRVNRK